MNTIELTAQFHAAFGQDAPPEPKWPGVKTILLRQHLLTEEVGELLEALAGGDLAGAFDALIDTQYVLDGAVLAFGFQRSWDPIQLVRPAEGVPSLPQAPLDVSRRLFDGLRWFATATVSGSYVERNLTQVLAALKAIQYALDFARNSMNLGGEVFNDGFREVHRSNMSKLGFDGRPILNDAGRVVKGPGYSPPDLASVLRGYGAALPGDAVLYREQTGEVQEVLPGGQVRLKMYNDGFHIDVGAAGVTVVRAGL